MFTIKSLKEQVTSYRIFHGKRIIGTNGWSAISAKRVVYYHAEFRNIKHKRVRGPEESEWYKCNPDMLREGKLLAIKVHNAN